MWVHRRQLIVVVYRKQLTLDDIQGGPTKVKQTTILLVTFECVGKIQ